MCSSPSFTILSDHSTYRCRPRWSSTTGNWAGAPGRASTGCSEGGNLQGVGSPAVKSFPQPSPGMTAGSSSLIYQHHALVRIIWIQSNLIFWDTAAARRYLLFHPLKLMVGTKRNATKQDRLVKIHTNVVPEWTKWIPILEKKKRRDFSQGVSVLCVGWKAARK